MNYVVEIEIDEYLLPEQNLKWFCGYVFYYREILLGTLRSSWHCDTRSILPLHKIFRQFFHGVVSGMKNDRQHGFDAVSTLKSTELFSSLDDEARGLIAKLIKWKSYQAGVEVVPYKGDGDDVHFIARGRVRVTIFSFGGKEISYQELGRGEMFGELSAIDQLPRTANVITLEKSHIGVLSSKDYWALFQRYPAVASSALKRLATLVRFLADRVYQNGALDVKERVRMEVLRLARENMSGDDVATIQNFPTHREIANRVNTHREAVTRELNELSRMGLIEQQQRVLTVTSVFHLQQVLAEVI